MLEVVHFVSHLKNEGKLINARLIFLFNFHTEAKTCQCLQAYIASTSMCLSERLYSLCRHFTVCVVMCPSVLAMCIVCGCIFCIPGHCGAVCGSVFVLWVDTTAPKQRRQHSSKLEEA